MGNNHTLDRLELQGEGRVLVCGSFAPNGSSALVATSTYGNGFTVAYTSTGLYTVTLNDAYAALESWWVDKALTTGDDAIVQVGIVDVVTAKTVQIRNWDIGDAAVKDVAAAAGNRISFGFVLKNTSVSY